MTQTTPTRRRFREFLLSVAIVHVIAIALYYALDLPSAPPRTQRAFAWGWMFVTVAVVLVGLQRLKRARRGPRPRGGQ
jgi:hypothetical protein